MSDRASCRYFQGLKEFGFQTAIDDFGAGYSGLPMLVDFQPDLVKLDMALLRGIDTDTAGRKSSESLLSVITLGFVIAEGIETRGERDFFAAHGVSLMQGYWFAKPYFNAIPIIDDAVYQG